MPHMRRAGGRHHPLRQHLSQRPNTMLPRKCPVSMRDPPEAGNTGFDDAAFRRADADRPERAFVVRQVRREHALHPLHRLREGEAHGGVDRPVDLRRGAGEIDVDRVAGDRQRHLECDRRVQLPVDVERACGRRRPARRGWPRASPLRSARGSRRRGRAGSSSPASFSIAMRARLHHVERDDLRPQVAHRLVGRAHVLADELTSVSLTSPRRSSS